MNKYIASTMFAIFIAFSLAACQYSQNLVMNYDNAASFDGPNGYALSPRGLAMDSSANLIFTDSNSVRMSIFNTSIVQSVSSSYTFPSGSYNKLAGVAVDSKGNIIVADSLNNQVKRIDVNGRVSVLGTNSPPGPSLVTTYATGFSQQRFIAFDSSSIMYVADYGNSAVKKVFPNGTVATLASIPNTVGMALDSNLNVYVGSDQTNLVYKITPAGSISVLAGNGARSFADGNGTFASFAFPFIGSVDASGNVYLADGGNQKIRKVTATGVVTTIAGTGAQSSGDGQGLSASFNAPIDAKIDLLGNLIVSDYYGCKVRKIYPNATVTTIAGSGTCLSIDGQGLSAGFNNPSALNLDGNGNIYVTDISSCQVRMINATNYVSTLTGHVCGSIVNGNLSVAQFSGLYGIAIDPNTGNIFVSDNGNNAVRKITFSKTALPFNSPTGVAVDLLGNIFVADQMNHMIKVINVTGVVNILSGSGTASFVDGMSAAFNSPYGIALDLYGNVIVADTGNNRIRNVTRAGSVTTIAGNGTAGLVDGQGTNSALNSPMGVAVDGMNRVFITDSANNCIRVINGTGYVNSLFLGRGSNILLNAPQGILVAPNGDLFIADTGNKRIRTIPASMLIGRI